MNTLWVDNHKTTILSQITIKYLRSGTLFFGEECLRLPHKKVVTHSPRSGFYMELFLSRVYPETIIIIRWWSRNAFLRYIRIQVSDLSNGISDLMVSTQSFYTITESEVIYYTSGQPRFQSHRLNPQRGITNNTTSSLLIPCWDGPQWSYTHATCSGKYDQRPDKMF